ncbi:AAA family ATPase [Alkaliphilus transvaalensis]|uniref:AAA family ATPase n=1 Tax=Alkaliphilus transvaalensis TaxID=114628 RepID=UPI000479A1C9|nr:AAA family ATPase [Alkaliphilus transvaalensis]
MRIHMVIADNDKDYLEALEGYLTENYQFKLHLSIFSRKEYLDQSLKEANREIDILLISPEMLSNLAEIKKIKKVILLIDGKKDMKDNQEAENIYSSILKYQPCHKLMGEVLDLYSEGSNNYLLPNGNTESKILSVYSPVGGSGKTTMAIGVATLLAQMGKRIFYLNLEGISSIKQYFPQETPHFNASNLFYLVKEQKKNLITKLSSMQIKDHGTQINYIDPFDSALEWDEIKEDDIDFLLKEIQNSGLYDYIIVDLSSNFDLRNIKAMTLSTSIIFVLQYNLTSKAKGEGFLKEIERLPYIKDTIQNKLILALNYASNIKNYCLAERSVDYYFPEDRELWLTRNNQIILNTNSDFSKALFNLIQNLEK